MRHCHVRTQPRCIHMSARACALDMQHRHHCRKLAHTPQTLLRQKSPGTSTKFCHPVALRAPRRQGHDKGLEGRRIRAQQPRLSVAHRLVSRTKEGGVLAARIVQDLGCFMFFRLDALGVGRSALGVGRSALGVGRSADPQRLALGVVPTPLRL